MARTEKKFGTANQVSSTAVTQLVAPSANRKNVIINAAGRGTGTLDIAVTTGTMALTASGSSTSAVTTTSRTAFATSIDTTSHNPDNSGNARSGVGFNKELTRAVWCGPGGEHKFATGIVNPSTGAITSANSNSYLGIGNSSRFVIHNYWSSHPLAGSNNIKLFGTAGVNRTTQTGASPAQSFIYSIGDAKYNTISSSGQVMQWVQASLLDTGVFAYEDYGTGSPVTGDTYSKAAGFVTIPTHPDPYIASGVYSFFDPTQGYTGHGVLKFFPAYGAAPVTEGSTYAYGNNGTNNATINDLGYQISNVFPFAYNNQRNHWAISHTTDTIGHASGWPTAGPTMTIPSNATVTNPGFRITVDDDTTAHPIIRAFWLGTSKTPAMPTGVTVPVSSRPVRSLKFSPDGTKLAVAYNRDYTGSGIAESVIVIYTWNSGSSTWVHTHSSGSAIPFRVVNNDCMVWADDSSVLGIGSTDGIIRMWGPGFTASKLVANIASGPDMASLSTAGLSAAHASTFTGSLDAGTGLTVVPGRTGTFITEIVYAPTTGSPYRFVAILNHTALAVPTSANSLTVADGATTVSANVTNYVSSVASNLPIVNGSVTQITGVVLEANEGLAVEASVSGIVDVNAYGVEIS